MTKASELSGDDLGLPHEINGKRMPFEIHGWLNTQMSIARYYGAIIYDGVRYVLDPRSVNMDECPLVREDLFKARIKAANKEKKARKSRSQQTSMVEDE